MKNASILFLILLLSLFQLSSCAHISDSQSGNAHIVILYTNDEHGWMEANDNADGAAGMFGLWKEKEGYREDGNFLILSGGDMWTGPAISTWFEGESMVDVMNAMHYNAAAVGNHEFDFKIEGLRKRLAQSKFPYISANIRNKSNGKIPDFVVPYIIKEIDDIKIGIIGLTTTSAPQTTFPDNVVDYDFIPYLDALNEVVPQVKKAGAEFLMIDSHICSYEMRTLAPEIKRLGISLITGGHCHEMYSDTLDGIRMVEAGSFMQSYAKIEITIDKKTNDVLSIIPSLEYNKDVAAPDTAIAAIVLGWKENLNTYLSEVIGYADAKISRNSDAMYNMITDSWLITFPEADVSLTNKGGIRQDIAQGDISLESMVGLLPFSNSLIKVKMTGEELKDGIGNLVFGGMTMTNGYKLSNGTPVYDDSVYQVLTTDYLYSRPDYSFQHVDSNPVRTSVHYRQPVIDWIKSLHTTSAKPLNGFLDYTPRR